MLTDVFTKEQVEALKAAFVEKRSKKMLTDVFTKEQVEALKAAFVEKTVETVETVETGSFWDECPNFEHAEFKCRCGGEYCNGDTAQPGENLVRSLQKIRNYTGEPITISSGVRCPKHNAAVGGVYNSHHLEGAAADFAVRGLKSSTTIQIINMLDIKYLELYAIDDSYVHMTVV